MERDEDDVSTLRRLTGLATPMALRVAATLGLPDRLDGAGAAVEDLAGDLDVDRRGLDLLLAHLVTLGVVERVPAGYRTTAFGAHLRADADNGLVDLLSLDAAGGRAELAFVELAHSVRTGRSGYAHRFGQDFWADLVADRRLSESFNRQMAHRFRDQVPRVVAGFDWSRFGTLVDVGGGRGTFLAAILAANPGVSGHLVDLGPTAAEARRAFEEQGLGARTRVTAGSFFDPLPAGADAYLLFDVLHDWDDEQADRVLGRCAEAVRPGGSVLVVEAVAGRWSKSGFDLAMLVIFGGRERRVEEFRALAAPHGLVLAGVVDLTGERCLLEFRRDG
ncbi:methyltransferase [Saccharothrix sp. Mg75]|uniref:methyltransferase n=1 Tax=Saccharothrix sp. Mg75 TaxID=3445357 RepID=UPI003EF07A91